MGKLNLRNKKMKAIVIFALIAVALAQAPVSPVDVCVNKVLSYKNTAEQIIDEVKTNPLKAATDAFAMIEDLIGDKLAECKGLQPLDIANWLDQHANAEQKVCLQAGIQLYFDYLSDKDLFKHFDITQIEKYIAAVKAVTQHLEGAYKGCKPLF